MDVKRNRAFAGVQVKPVRQKSAVVRRSSRSIPIRMTASVDDRSGKVLAAYFHIRKGVFGKTEVIRDGILNADYDKNGNLLGVEVLGPCGPSVLRHLPERQVALQLRHMLPIDFAPVRSPARRVRSAASP